MKVNDEARALALLELVLAMDRRDRDALPGEVVRHVKEASTILRKRRPKK